ncbi:MAG TPA: hypothetical protein VH741_09710 [Candidatus Limnocylindrales bacterium]
MNRKLVLLLPALVVAIACGGAGPAPTGTPGATTPGQTQAGTPTGGLPTPTGGGSTVAPGTGFCRILTAAEVGAVIGGTVQLLPDSEGDDTCTYTTGLFTATINVRAEEGDSREGARFILSDQEELTVGGNPALFGTFAGHLLYIVKGGNTLVFQAIWSEPDNAAAKAKLVQLGEVAIARFPLP